jgi:hypothetical protein
MHLQQWCGAQVADAVETQQPNVLHVVADRTLLE